MLVHKVETHHSHPFNLSSNNSPVIKQENFLLNVPPSNVPLTNVRRRTSNAPAHLGSMDKEGIVVEGMGTDRADIGAGWEIEGATGICRRGISIRRRLRRKYILF